MTRVDRLREDGVMDLREALERFDKARQVGADGVVVYSHSPIVEAARLLLEGREVWWCQGTRIEDGQFKGILPGSSDWQNCFEGRIPRHRDCGPVRVVPVKEQK